MSELKAGVLVAPHNEGMCFHRSSAVIAVTEGETEFYLKSEADKVIAELKAQKAQAEDDCAYWKMSESNAANAMHETEEYAMQLYKEARHQKYKRCLAMANYWGLLVACTHREIQLKCMRRELKWHKLAEQFKGAK